MQRKTKKQEQQKSQTIVTMKITEQEFSFVSPSREQLLGKRFQERFHNGMSKKEQEKTLFG